jgi:hypothetical protein
MKVYGTYRCEMLMPYWIETLLDLYASRSEAVSIVDHLNKTNDNVLVEDGYGPYHGCKYEVRELEIK